jgi:hypothetical protein
MERYPGRDEDDDTGVFGDPYPESKPDAVAALYAFAQERWGWGSDEFFEVQAAVEVVREADAYQGAVEALQHIAVHGEHDQECHRPPQDCASDWLEAHGHPTRLGGQ